MDIPLVSIITPTFNQQDMNMFRRTLAAVQTQTYPNWEHFVCSDGSPEPAIRSMMERFSDGRRSYINTKQYHGGYGAFVRQEVMMDHAKGKYYVFLDDDNILMPEYLEKMVGALETAKRGERFVICKILHFGPLMFQFGIPPVYLRGEPKVQHIDTLQIMVEADAMRQVGWISGQDYYSDGYTYEELGRRFAYVRIEDCLAIHM